MKNIITSIAIIALLGGCAQLERRSSVELSDLTRAAANDMKNYHNWVESDPSRFPAGLCLERVSISTNLSNTQSVNGDASIPLAVGTFTLGLGGKRENTKTTTLPFVPFYPKPRSDAPKTKQQRSDWYANWVKTLQDPASKPVIFERPAEYGDVDFNQDQSLAAELWRIRAAIHHTVLDSMSEAGSFIYPESFEITRVYFVSSSPAKITLALKGIGNLGGSVTDTSKGTLTIKFAKNNSLDPLKCDNTSFQKE